MEMLKTRLFKPPVQEGYLIRTRLLDKLMKNQYKPVTLVVAPAGYGKSVAVSQWLDIIKTNYSWISLNKDGNELKEFLRLLCTSLLPYLSKDDDIFEILTEAPELPNLDHITKQIVNSLAAIQDEHILVLDDYHLIENPDVHKLMQILVSNIKQKHIITFISRFDPPLKWNKLKSYDLVNEIRTIDLQFSLEEISELSTRVFSNPLDRDITSIILKSTEGWIVPTRLILKNIAENNLNPKILEDKAVVKLEQTFVFLEDTLKQEDREIQKSLMIASLFNRFSISLLSEIFIKEYPGKNQESELFKNKMKKFISQSTFIISIDNNKNWFRFHDLIRDFLNKRIYSGFSQDKINSVLITGSKFFENNQSFEEAIQLAVKGGNIPFAIAIIERNRGKFINNQQFDVLERWLKFIPQGMAEKNPSLLVTRAILFERNRNIERMVNDLENAYALLSQQNEQDENSRHQWGEFYAIKCITDFFKGNINEALTDAIKAMDLLSSGHYYLYYFAMAHRVFALNSLGKRNEAFDLLVRNKRSLELAPDNYMVENHVITTMLLMINGKLKEMKYEAALARNMARRLSKKASFVMANYYLAVSYYFQNEIEEALTFINDAIEIRFLARPTWIILCYYLKAACMHALGKLPEYKSCLTNMNEFVLNYSVPFYKNISALVQIELALLKGNVPLTLEKYVNINFKVGEIIHFHYKPFLTEVKLLIARGDRQSLKQADDLLKQYEKNANLSNNRMSLLQINCLNILLLEKQNKTEEAIELLRLSLAETKDDGLIRLYIDSGSVMKKLFYQLPNKDKKDANTREILKIFNISESINKFSDILDSEYENNLDDNDEFYKLKITIRDVRLLNLLNEDLRNKEIADLLNITTDSVKKSLYRLYKKLDVNRRADALKKAHELNLVQMHHN